MYYYFYWYFYFYLQVTYAIYHIVVNLVILFYIGFQFRY